MYCVSLAVLDQTKRTRIWKKIHVNQRAIWMAQDGVLGTRVEEC